MEASKNDEAKILPVVIGTAGHVDHGKTQLVKHLTSVDTDRLKEEQERHLTIDLGFASYRIESTGQLTGLVDVPGHEDFIRNMVAGAATIDLLLLVIAADDGIMPQTREHMTLVRLLGTPKVLVALTKVDLVDPEWTELVQEEVTEFMTGLGFRNTPIIPVSSQTGEGIPKLKENLDQLIQQVRHPHDPRAFRVNIARVFSLKGIGTVATGVPLSGQLQVGDTVEVLPGGPRSTIRDLQTYHQPSKRACSHISCAFNLRDVTSDRLHRGMTLAAPGTYLSTTCVIGTFENASDSLKLKSPMQVKLHSGTSAIPAKGQLIGHRELSPQASTFIKLTLDEPVALAAGDNYVLRQASPAITLGGGRVLSASRSPGQRVTGTMLPELELAKEALEQGDFFQSELMAGPDVLAPRDRLKALTQLPEPSASEIIDAKVADNSLRSLGADLYLVNERTVQLRNWVKKVLQRYHRSHPYTWGMTPSHLTERLQIPRHAAKNLVDILTEDPAITVKHEHLALAEFKPAISNRQIQWLNAIEKRLRQFGANCPSQGDLMSELAIPSSDFKVLIRLLVEEGKVSQIGKHLVLTEVLNDCRQALLQLFEQNDIVEIAPFREATGLSRNLAVEILEQFDRQGLTRRVENGRVLVRQDRS